MRSISSDGLDLMLVLLGSPLGLDANDPHRTRLAIQLLLKPAS